MRPIGQEPISCFCSVRQLDVQVHPLDMTLVCRRDLPPNPTLEAESQAARHRVPFIRFFGNTRPGFEPRPPGNRSLLFIIKSPVLQHRLLLPVIIEEGVRIVLERKRKVVIPLHR